MTPSILSPLLVAVGGGIGATLRYLLTVSVPEPLDFPVVLCALNVVGSLLLGALVGVLGRLALEQERSERIRLLLGTGVLGGFTTYSAFTVAALELAETDRVLIAVAFAVLSVILGALAAAAGLRLGCGRPTGTTA